MLKDKPMLKHLNLKKESKRLKKKSEEKPEILKHSEKKQSRT